MRATRRGSSRSRRKDTLVLYELRGRRDYFQGYMVPSTGLLREFALEWFQQGFLLRFPHQATPLELAPVEPFCGRSARSL